MTKNIKKFYKQPQFAVTQLEAADVIVCSPYEVKGKSGGAGQTVLDIFSVEPVASSWDSAPASAPASAPEPASVSEPQAEPIVGQSEEGMSSN